MYHRRNGESSCLRTRIITLIVYNKTYIHFCARDLIPALRTSVRAPTQHVCMRISHHTLTKNVTIFSF